MEEGLAAITGFLESYFNTQEERIEFVQQVFTRLTFFLFLLAIKLSCRYHFAE